MLAPPINRVEPRNDDNVRTIYIIHGGSGFNGAFNNVHKRYTQEMRGAHVYNLHKGSSVVPITFTNNDKTSTPYEDPLVVTFRVGLCVLVES